MGCFNNTNYNHTNTQSGRGSLQNRDPRPTKPRPLLQNQDPYYKTKTPTTNPSPPTTKPRPIDIVPTFMFSDVSLHSGFISFCVASLICIDPARYRNYLEMIQPLILQEYQYLQHSTRPSSTVIRESPEAVRVFPEEV
jgi:hypothetical protein